ncbi:tetratricopeptide repeat protein [Desulfuromonas thiophila]|uniref:Sel1 repeat-containing protein n=1 Tax=Desulfuromonas thiophila TaxID=57664 RepID=A0A1G6XKN8_9BACT|nr:SEL1-like repeat protein [Desulfuromonas thiophila]SDD78769.1 Sel1 repeat-containing protein [Desulfuromonas thiophila]
MTARKRLLLNSLFFFVCVAIATAAILYNYSYKVCWRCDTQDYYQRGKEFVCRAETELQETGIDFLRLAAERGWPQAKILLAESYSNHLPDGYQPLDHHASHCLNGQLGDNAVAARALFNDGYQALRAQKANDSQLLYNMGLLYNATILAGDQPDQLALQCFEQAAEAGHQAARLHLARHFHQRSDYPRASHWLLLAAEAGSDPAPALQLGDYHFYGRGLEQDYNKAVNWYRQALKIAKQQAARQPQAERAAVEDEPRARIDMALRKLQQNRHLTPLTLGYRVVGDANRFEVLCDGHDGPIGTIERDPQGLVARLASDLELPVGVATAHKTFGSLDAATDWLLQTYGRSRHGSSKKFYFQLQR